VILCRRGKAEAALQSLREIMGKLKLTVNEEKTRICKVPEGEFDFLGYTFGRMFSARTGQAHIGYRLVDGRPDRRGRGARRHLLRHRRGLWTRRSHRHKVRQLRLAASRPLLPSLRVSILNLLAQSSCVGRVARRSDASLLDLACDPYRRAGRRPAGVEGKVGDRLGQLVAREAVFERPLQVKGKLVDPVERNQKSSGECDSTWPATTCAPSDAAIDLTTPDRATPSVAHVSARAAPLAAGVISRTADRE
jgi:hypothetical protein